MIASHDEYQPMPSLVGILFAEDFDDDDLDVRFATPDASGASIDAEQPIPQISPKDLEAAEKAAFAQGLAAGEANLNLQLTCRTTDLLQQIAEALDATRHDAAAIIEGHVEAVAKLIVTSVASTLPSLCAQRAPVEIAYVISDLFITMIPETTLCVTVSSDIQDALRSALSDLSSTYARRVVIASDDGIACGNAIFSWETGAASRNARKVLDATTQILARFDLLNHSSAPPHAPSPIPLWVPSPIVTNGPEKVDTLNGS